MFIYCNNSPIVMFDPEGEFGLLAMCVVGLVVSVASTYSGDVFENVSDGKTGGDVFIPKSTVGEYVEAAITGFVGPVGPGASVAASFIAPAVGYAIDGTIDCFDEDDSPLRDYSLSNYAIDVGSNLVSTVVSTKTSLEMPEFIRDIKDDAIDLGIKGANRLNSYLSYVRYETLWTNSQMDLIFGVSQGVIENKVFDD